MKKIGQGLSYSVFEINKQRVLKKPTSIFYRFFKLLFWSIIYKKNFSLLKKFSFINKSSKQSIIFLEKHQKSIDMNLIGNPIFLKKFSYTQDRAEIFKNYFKKHSFKENKKIIQKYVQHTFSLWEQGISDIDFNFMTNSGINEKGEIILADINGITRKKEELKIALKNQFWKEKYSFTHLVDRELKQYIQGVFEQELSVQNLEKYWRERRNFIF